MFTLSELENAWKSLSKNRRSFGIDGVTIEQFKQSLESQLLSIETKLSAGTYKFSPLRGVAIPKPEAGKVRPIQIPVICDRVVAKAIALRLEPVLSPFDLPNSFGYRRGISRDHAVEKIFELARSGLSVVLEADIKNFFGEVSQERLFAKLSPLVSDDALLALIRAAIWNEVGNRAELGQHEHAFPKRGEGIPQGAVLSPLLANFYMHSFDKYMDENGRKLVRYADDFVAMCESRTTAKEVANQAIAFLQQELGLTMHPLGSTKTKIVNIATGFTFLGFKIIGTTYHPSDKSVANLKLRIDKMLDKKTGKPLFPILRSVNDALRGWQEAYRKSDMSAAAKDINAHSSQSVTSYLTKNKFLGQGATVSKKQLRILGVPTLSVSLGRRARPAVTKSSKAKSPYANE